MEKERKRKRRRRGDANICIRGEKKERGDGRRIE